MKELTLAFPQKQIDAVDKLGAGEWLGNVIVRAKFVSAQDILVLNLGRQKNDGNSRRVCHAFQVCQDFQAVHFRHHNVEDNQVRLLIFQ